MHLETELPFRDKLGGTFAGLGLYANPYCFRPTRHVCACTLAYSDSDSGSVALLPCFVPDNTGLAAAGFLAAGDSPAQAALALTAGNRNGRLMSRMLRAVTGNWAVAAEGTEMWAPRRALAQHAGGGNE